MSSRLKAFFFDRDGILNMPIGVRPPWSLSEISYYHYSKYLIDIVESAGYLPVVVTNQPDAARNLVKQKTLQDIGNVVCRDLRVKHYYACYHGKDNECCCRKPKPGMLFSASKQLDIDLNRSFLIGDRMKDIRAGNAAGCITILFNHTDNEVAGSADAQPDYCFGSFSSLANFLLATL